MKSVEQQWEEWWAVDNVDEFVTEGQRITLKRAFYAGAGLVFSQVMDPKALFGPEDAYADNLQRLNNEIDQFHEAELKKIVATKQTAPLH